MTTRANIPDKDNWGKLKIILKCVLQSMYLPLILRNDNLEHTKRYAYASYIIDWEFNENTWYIMIKVKVNVVNIPKRKI